MKTILTKIINLNKSFTWNWTIDGMDNDMITTKKGKYIFDICIDYTNDERAFIYVYYNRDLIIITANVEDIQEILNGIMENGHEKYKG